MKKKYIKTDLIKQYLKDNNLSKTAFCKKCKISPATFKKIIEQDMDVNIVSIFKIAFAMEIRVHEIFCDKK